MTIKATKRRIDAAKALADMKTYCLDWAKHQRLEDFLRGKTFWERVKLVFKL
jgi:hypothetical protein